MIALAALLFVPAAASPVATPTPTPLALPTATPEASAQPATATPAIGSPGPTQVASPVAPVPSPTPNMTATPTPAPVATATPSPYHYRFVPHVPAHPAPGDPIIYAVYLNESRLRSAGPIDIRVETSPEVVKVISRSNGRDGVVPLISPGVFVAQGKLPKIPFIAEGMSVDLQFIATTADGRKIIVSVPVRLD